MASKHSGGDTDPLEHVANNQHHIYMLETSCPLLCILHLLSESPGEVKFGGTVHICWRLLDTGLATYTRSSAGCPGALMSGMCSQALHLYGCACCARRLEK